MSSNAYYCHVFKNIILDKKYGAPDKAYENWKEHLHSFGLGVKLGTDLAYESKGLIYPATYFDKYYGKGRWNHNTIISLAIGQGELGFTPLQIANMTAAIANRGYYIVPHIVKKIDSTDINKLFTVKKNTGIDEKYFPPVIEGMEKVVTSGTASRAYLKDIAICGKTGTAQIAQNNKGYNKTNYKASFCGYFPAEDPMYSCIVVINNPSSGYYYGSSVAAPVFKYISDRIYSSHVEIAVSEEEKTSHPNPAIYYKAGASQDYELVYQKMGINAAIDAGSEFVIGLPEGDSAHYAPRRFKENQIPKLIGMTAKDAVYLLEDLGMVVKLQGQGFVKSQSIAAGSLAKKGKSITLKLSNS